MSVALKNVTVDLQNAYIGGYFFGVIGDKKQNYQNMRLQNTVSNSVILKSNKWTHTLSMLVCFKFEETMSKTGYY